MATQAPSRIGLACPKCRRALYPIGDMEPDICVYCGTDLHGLATEPAPAAPVVPDGPVPHTAGPQAPEREEAPKAPITQTPPEKQTKPPDPEPRAPKADQRSVPASGVSDDDGKTKGGSALLVLGAGVALIGGLLAWDRLANAPASSGTRFRLDSHWQTITLPPGTRMLEADGPFRMHVNGELFVVPEGEGVAVPLPGLHGRLEARAAGAPVTVEVIY